MGRPKGSKNKSTLQNEPKPQDTFQAQNIPAFISDPAGRINVRVSTATKDGLAQLKDDFGLHSQEEVLEKAIAIVMALRKAVAA
ncbi:hypothetical protein G5S34_22535 [Herbaspirillum frisingense]|uniref:hypothetical protein n=1 Tax=Herbaspirillum frisingense TaxID=92645 RepID=UPI001600AC1C|nr:hypothetical protein [Herbaspirillum frisingense]QNB05323.1 hypothetical protein G5S34_22535 [Herbaspirillum frisingense]